MKKFLFAAMAALAMTSCTQDEEYTLEQDSKIEFNGIVRNATKATVATNDNLEAFGVYGYKTGDSWTAETPLVAGFIDDLTVTKAGSEWSSNKVFYWPNSGKVQFFATSPAQTLTITANAPSFNYTVLAESENQIDLLAASKLNADKIAGTIQFPFKHLLTQVNFTVKGDKEGFTYTVSSIVLKGVKNTGTFTFNADATLGAWSSIDGSASYTCGKDLTLTGTEAVKLDNDPEKSLLMLIPVSDITGATVEIAYKAESKVDAADGFSGTKTATLSGKWDMGKRVRYTLELACDATSIIVGAPTVDGWETPETDNPVKPSSN